LGWRVSLITPLAPFMRTWLLSLTAPNVRAA
jgi:hypothetical protein